VITRVVSFRGPSCSLCEQLEHEDVTLDGDAIAAWASNIQRDDVQSACKSFGNPLKLSSLEDEISFFVLMRLLDFGSGYDSLLLGKGKGCARDVVQVCIQTGTPRTACLGPVYWSVALCHYTARPP
jgi:hypothetical protein